MRERRAAAEGLDFAWDLIDGFEVLDGAASGAALSSSNLRAVVSTRVSKEPMALL